MSVTGKSDSLAGVRPVILSGGSGTRLWPLSRKEHPKQFLALQGEHSLLQETLFRISRLELGHVPLIVGNERQRFLIRRQLHEIKLESKILLEPVGRNTAPALAVAALGALQEDPDAILLVLPADHLLSDFQAFRAAIVEAYPVSQDGAIVVFGIRPPRPHTGYGYIVVDTVRASGKRMPVLKFQEKPDLETARRLLTDGNCFWNSGMFLLRADVYVHELEQYAADIMQSAKQAFSGGKAEDPFFWLDDRAFENCRSESIDYAVMEHTRLAQMVELESPWSDLGSFASLWEVDHDEYGNRIRGDVRLNEVSGSFIHSSSRLVTVMGIHNAVIIETPDAVLVAALDQAHEVKSLVGELERDGRSEANLPTRVQRPWGWYESVSHGHQFQVKRIQVDPGAHLSLQSHHHRSEHWVVTHGQAQIVRGEDEFMLDVNQSTYIPAGTRHRLSNPGPEPLEIIEVQTGDYLGEDDIVRFEDIYGRCKP
ncbi:MAG: mannose-1-phosphate guanylyltransferase/mannose-6-phosphate isomerase [Gammaproteobacteria bacterium]